MAFIHGKNTEVFFDKYDFTEYFDMVKVDMNADTAETTTFGNDSKKYIAGLKDATMSLEGFFDGDANAVDEELWDAFGTVDKLWSVYPEGDAVGKYGYAMKATETAYSVDSTLDGASRISAAVQSNVDAERVASLHALGAQAAENWTGDTNNYGAASASGGSAYLHVTAATGTIEISIRHSDDNFDADDDELEAFTAATGATSERKTFSGAVKQYVRGIATIGAEETITFQLGFCRNT